MKILAIQHDAADPPAHAGTIVEDLGHELSTVRLDRGDPIPTSADADMLMTFGGAISLTNDELPAWVRQEQNLIRLYAHSGRRVLGICLGSQMVASALGAPVQGKMVRRNEQPEVGWLPVRPIADTRSKIAKLFDHPPTVFHWHQDTFKIPEGAEHVLKSDACHHQAFSIDDRILGMQFHLEANRRTVETFLFVSRLWRQTSPSIQTEKEITDGIDRFLSFQQELLRKVIQQLLR
jgi:GMP synthase-like glutamine amidotransferase